MSDLVDRVKQALRDVEACVDDFGTPFVNIDGEARAAIKAVAEWLAQTEDRECNPLQALANELKEGSE
jgi:hypothetical protein